MKIRDLFEEVLKFTPMMMGLSQFDGKDYALVGGTRSGSSPAGTLRLKYMIVDKHLYSPELDENEYVIGNVELFVDGSNKIRGLVNIELNKNARGGRVNGRTIVNDIVDTAGGELEIHDVQRNAIGFWEKMGIEWKRNGLKSQGVIRR